MIYPARRLLSQENRSNATYGSRAVLAAGSVIASTLKRAVSWMKNPFRAAVPFWGHLGINYLEFEWFVPKTGLRFFKG